MSQKQYASLTTLQTFLDNIKARFATKATLDELSADVAYINSSDNETITDVNISESGGSSAPELVGEIVLDSTKGELYQIDKTYGLTFNEEFAATVADTLSKLCTLGKSIYVVCSVPTLGELTATSVFTSSVGDYILSFNFVNEVSSLTGADMAGFVFTPTKFFCDYATTYEILSYGMTMSYKFYAVGGGSGGSIDVTASVGQTIIVKEVDGNGKPTKWESAEYQPRTHWTEVVQGDLVPHMTFTPVMNEAFQMLLYNLPAFDFAEGKTYTVIYDGVEYTGTAEAGVFSGVPFVSVGNTILHGVQSTEPFFVAQIPAMGVFAVICFTADEHTIQIIGEKTVHHKIPDEYVRGDNFKIEVSMSATGDGLIANKTFEEIAEAVQAGKNVFVEEKSLYSNGVGISHLKFENIIDNGDNGGEAMFTALEDAGTYIRLVVMKIGNLNNVRCFSYEMLSI